MKGKGKKGRDSDEECPLQFLDFRHVDHSRSCPRYSSGESALSQGSSRVGLPSALSSPSDSLPSSPPSSQTVLNRTEEEGVGFEDLDALQLELETLLVSVTQRQMQLENETEALLSWQDSRPKEPKERKSLVKVEKEVSGKRSRGSDQERPSKKLKDVAATASVASSTSSASGISSLPGKSHLNRSKSKNPQVKQQDYEGSDAVIPHPQPARNDIPDRFWTFIEPYCSPAKPENVKMLEDLLKAYDDDADYLKVPSLGKHYTLKWASIGLDDHWEGKKEGSKSSSEKKKGLSAANSVTSPEKGRLSKRNKDPKNDPDKSFGVFTQRLVSCLLEENANNSMSDSFELEHDPIGKNGSGGNANIFKALSLGNTAQLEKRIKKELEDNGLLDLGLDDVFGPHETPGAEDDEVLKELTRCQNELKMLSSQNQSQLKCLLTAAQKDLEKQEVMKKLQTADDEVMEVYRRLLSAKQKKRTPTKKEKEMAWRALKDRDALLIQLHSLGSVSGSVS